MIRVSHLFFESAEALGAAFGEAAESQADIPNFTNAAAGIQISDVVA